MFSECQGVEQQNQVYPFHAVGRGDLTKHSVVIQDGRVCGVIELWVVRC